jgi:small subunit ribosomal protein S17
MNVQELSKMDNNKEILNNPAEVANTNAATKKTTRKRVLVGKVTSNKGDKTITVASERQVIHPLYKKYFKVTKKFMAHDENNECNKGDLVKIIESRPLSAKKRWNLVEILERAK